MPRPFIAFLSLLLFVVIVHSLQTPSAKLDNLIHGGHVSLGLTAHGSVIVVDDLDHEWLDSFIGNSTEARGAIQKFWTNLKDSSSPSLAESFKIEKFIGWGTHTFTFQARSQHSGSLVALKCTPLTQSHDHVTHAIVQWYISSYLRRLHVAGAVLSEEQTYVVTRSDAPEAFRHELEVAHHADVKYTPSQFQIEAVGQYAERYLCLAEPLMPWGTLDTEDLPPHLLLKCLTDVATTLAEMHRNNVSHGDVYVKNMMLEKHEDIVTSAKIIDFGSAQITQIIGDPDRFNQDVQGFVDVMGTLLYRAAFGEFRRDLSLTQDIVLWFNTASFLFQTWERLKTGTAAGMSDIAQMMASKIASMN